MPKFSIIIPVFNRPQELDELLESLTLQSFTDFDVVVVEDGSTVSSESVFEKYSGRLSITYFYKPNTGPGPSRNFGFARAKGEYFVVFDSDCVVPPAYLEAVDDRLRKSPLDVWGGPDRGRDDFTPLQRAMGYSMSSMLTTGGIRGGKKRLGNFQPRSFNMGMNKSVFQLTQGFKFDRYAEDIEFSIRCQKLGLKVGLIPEAYVYHKRRTNLWEFFRQVSNFGKGRVMVNRVHPGAIKLTHSLPAFFLFGLLAIPVLLAVSRMAGLALSGLYLIYCIAVCIDSGVRTRNFLVALLAVPAALIQLAGYGFGFLKELFRSK